MNAITQSATESTQNAQTIVNACMNILTGWSEMLNFQKSPSLEPNFSSKRGGSNAKSSADNSDSNEDVTLIDAVISDRGYIESRVSSWARWMRAEYGFKLHDPCVESMHGIPKSCAFIMANVDLIDDSDMLDLMARELKRCAKMVDRVLSPWLDGPLLLGACPMKGCDGVVTLKKQKRMDRDGIAACGRCGVKASTKEWEHLMKVETPNAVDAQQVIDLAHKQFGIRLTKRAIEGYVARGTLTPVDAEERPQKFYLTEVVAVLTKRQGV